MYFIYALFDPRTDITAYIGITKDVQKRLEQHIKQSDTNLRKKAWIQKLQREQIAPSIRILETVGNEAQAREREEYWIRYYLEQGVSLTNIRLCPSVSLKKHEVQERVSSGKTLFRRALPQDAQDMCELAYIVMGEYIDYEVSVEKRLTYLTRPLSEISHILQRDGKILGFFTILPLKHDLLLRLMRNEVRASQIPLDDYAKLAPGERIDCFVWEIMADPDNKYLSAHLINKMLKFFHTLGKRGVEIEGMYAKATSPEGMDLLWKLGMQEMQMSKELQLDYVPFEMKIQQMRNSFTRNYLQALKNYQRRYP